MPMRLTIAVLEDNDDRIAAIERCLADKFPFFESRFFRTATEAIHWLDDHLESAVCISLDHDLEPSPFAAGVDPGTGREVADFLARREPRCPVVIHSSNLDAAIGMQCVLEGMVCCPIGALWRLGLGERTWFSRYEMPLLRTLGIPCRDSPLVQDR